MFSMSSFALLADSEAQYINGGFGGVFLYRSFSYKSATTSVTQNNDARNLGVGLLFGIGNATSEQVNMASVATVVA